MINKKIVRTIFCSLIIFIIMSLFSPYFQVANLTRQYGEYFKESYTQSEWFREEDFASIRVLRYKDESAKVTTDSGFVREMMLDERKNIAVVCYDSIYVMVFQCEEGEWKLDIREGGAENWIVLQSATTSNVMWPFYF